MAVYRKLQDAMIKKDTDTIRQIMGSDTVVRHITGRTQTMNEWLSDVENGEMKYYSIKIEDLNIGVKGNRASLTCSNIIDARMYGSRGTWTLPGNADFKKVNGKWLMVSSEND